MKIIGIEFGKKKGEQHFNNKIGDDKYKNDKKLDKSKSSSKDDQNSESTIKDSLSIYYKPYSRYQNFVKQIKTEGWNYVGDMQTYSMNHLDSNIVSTYFVGKNMYGTFLDIRCPAPYFKITICGFDDAGIDPSQFYSHSNFYTIPHFFSIICTDKNGKELSSNVTIDIAKVKPNGEIKKLCSEFYGDISQHTDGRFRRKEERYYFSASIKLEDTERLSFRTNPDIDIEKTKLFMKADLFENIQI